MKEFQAVSHLPFAPYKSFRALSGLIAYDKNFERIFWS